MAERKRFKQDNSGHWYLIPVDKVKRFSELRHDHDAVEEFENEFAHCRGVRPEHTDVYVADEVDNE